MKHATTIEGGATQLASDLGDLRYDTLEEFLRLLSEKLQKDAVADRTRGRPILSSRLERAAVNIANAAANIALAWKVSHPHMKDDDGS